MKMIVIKIVSLILILTIVIKVAKTKNHKEIMIINLIQDYNKVIIQKII